jgi:5'-nucleotidase
MDALRRTNIGHALVKFLVSWALIGTGVLLICGAAFAAVPTSITILHTNDMHAHLQGFGPEGDYTPLVPDNDDTVGGFSRIAAKVQEIRAARANPVLLVDSGDFMMGTAFAFLRGKSELTLMDALGYDVLTLGNHEFDWGPVETYKFFKLIPDIPLLHIKVVASNLIFSSTSSKDDLLESLFGIDNVIQPYWIKEIDGYKVGFFGLMGVAAGSVAPFASPVKFETPSVAAQAEVTALQAAGAQLIVCLSHSSLTEDTALAQAVPGIDVIISGHTHEKTTTPITVGTTLIVQAGDLGQYLGVLDLTLSSPPSLDSYELVTIDDTITGDATIQDKVNTLKSEIDTVLAGHSYPYTYDQIIAETAYDLIATAGKEANLGNLVTDSMRWMVDQVEYDPWDPDSRKVDFAFESNGVIRDNILKGTTGRIAFSDAFRALPLGFGLEKDSEENPLVGYPMLTIYVTAAEVKKALEVLTTVYPLKGSDYWLNISGLRVEYNPNLLPFFRVRRIYVGTEGHYESTPLDTSFLNTKLYKITVNYYVAQFINVVGEYTYGILAIDPKDKNGISYNDEVVHPDGLNEARVDRDPVTAGVQELQEWKGFVSYLENFPNKSGDVYPDVPNLYAGPTGRITETTCFINTASM